MAQWKINQAPLWFPTAVKTKSGWINKLTGEILVAIGNLDSREVDARIQRIIFDKPVYEIGDTVWARVKFDEKVDITQLAGELYLPLAFEDLHSNQMVIKATGMEVVSKYEADFYGILTVPEPGHFHLTPQLWGNVFEVATGGQIDNDTIVEPAVISKVGNILVICDCPISDIVYKDNTVGERDGINLDFVLQFDPILNSEMVYRNGLLLSDDVATDYSLTGRNLEMSPGGAPQATDVFYVVYIKDIPDNSFFAGNVLQETPVGDIDGVNMAFGISEPVKANTHKLFLNGLLLKETDEYSIAGTNIVMAYAPNLGDILYFTGIADDVSVTVDYIREQPAGLKDGVNTHFTISQACRRGSELIYVNGLCYRYGSDYVVENGDIMFVVPPSSTDMIEFIGILP